MTLSPIKVNIKSFQSIEEIEFDIHGFTCITGVTNIGKSAIVRAINGALTNIPVGSLVRKGAKYCSVSIDTEQWGILWEKGERGVNRYFFRGKDKPLDKVGAGQVEEIASLGFGSVKIGSSQIYPWIAPQFEPLFLLNQSGPAITDFISEVSRLQVLQDAISINIRNRKRALDEIKVRSEDIQKLQNKEQALSQCDTALQIRDELEAQVQSIKEYEDKLIIAESLSGSISQIENILDKINSIDEIRIPDPIPVEEYQRMHSMFSMWMALEQAACRIISLRDISSVNIPEVLSIEDISTIEQLSNRIDELNRSIQILSKDIRVPRLKEALPELSKMEGILTRLETIEAEKNTFSKQLGAIDKELGEIQEEITKIPLCPVCSRPTQTHIHI